MILLRQHKHNILFHTTTIAIVILSHILIISSPALGFVGNSDRSCGYRCSNYSCNRYHDKSRAAAAADAASSASLCKSSAWIIHNNNNRENGRGTRLTMNMMPSQRQQELIELGSASNKSGGWGGDALFMKMASIFSQSAATRANKPYNVAGSVQLVTLLRVGIPSLIAGVASTFLFPFLALFLASVMNDAGVFAVLSQDSSQFVQNFLTVSGLLFSILVGQTYYFMYQQQEAVYYALFNEVTEAKSLLEQVALVCQGRSMYKNVLNYISSYVEYDLKQLQCDPAILLSARPIDDPLESIMYMTSVGVPSSVYETVRSLRQARATRLGALQRKLPKVHMLLLWILAGIELVSFPLLGAGTQTIGGYNILTVEGCLFGVMTFGIVMTMRVSKR